MESTIHPFPLFYAQVPSIRLYDPLARLLGAAAGGVIEYGYADAVRLAGHSCPTVASAYGLTRLALKALYGEAMPERGGLRVGFAMRASDGVTGVVAAIVSMLTGAAGEGGFKGLAGQFRRQGLLAFGAEQPLEMRFVRLDNGAAVDAAANPGSVWADPRTGTLLQRCLSGAAGQAEQDEFGRLWQDRVRRILLEHGEDPEVFVIRGAPSKK